MQADPVSWAGLSDAVCDRHLDALKEALATRLTAPDLAAALAPILGRGAELSVALESGAPEATDLATGRLAGLGVGSTPAGDDYLIGVFYALRASGQSETARRLAAIAAERTTTRSGGWLLAAADGAASPAWSRLLEVLSGSDDARLSEATVAVLDCGFSSGTASLCGLVDGFNALRGRGAASAVRA